MTVGGLSRHVYDLSRYLVRQGCEVHVITAEIGNYPHNEIVEGVHVHRVHVMKPDGEEFIHWAFQLNLMMIDTCRTLVAAGLTFDLIHAHDWLVCYAAQSIKELYDLPVIATIHATEHGRNHGIYSDLQKYIHSLEWQLTYEAWRVIVCSTYMQQEVVNLFQLPHDKVDILPNGVDPELLQARDHSPASKQGYALEDERIVLFLGRLVREKGVQTLLEAAPSILAEHPDVKFVIVGQGYARADLEQRAMQLGISHKVLFTGFVSDEDRNRLLTIADVAVFPSLYEPFGIVALEAMAAGTPVVVSDVGGLADVVEHGRNGLKMYPGDAHSLAVQVNSLLQAPEWATKLADTALTEIGRYDWNRIAEQTSAIYQQVLQEQKYLKDVSQVAVPV
jgi:1,4-alpha-glucan branching enzyme